MELPKRKPNRLQTYDYSSPGAYFVTICTQDRKCILCNIVGGGALDAPNIKLTDIGAIVERYILSSNNMENIIIENHVIMPNHIHLLIRVDGTRDVEGAVPYKQQNSPFSFNIEAIC